MKKTYSSAGVLILQPDSVVPNNESGTASTQEMREMLRDYRQMPISTT